VKLPYEEFDLSGLQCYPLASRPSKVRVADFARPEAARALGDVAAAFPDLLGGADFKAVVAAMRAAHAAGRPIVWGLGAHVIKTGLAPILIDLMERGFGGSRIGRRGSRRRRGAQSDDPEHSRNGHARHQPGQVTPSLRHQRSPHTISIASP